MSYALHEKVLYRPKKGKPRIGKIMPGFVVEDEVKLLLEGDPFPVNVPASQVSACVDNRNTVESERKVPKDGTKRHKEGRKVSDTATKPNAKALRKQAQALGVEGWEDMGLKEMAKAIAKAEAAESGKPAKSSKKGKKGKSKAKAEAPAAKPAKGSKPKQSATKPKASATKPAAKATKPEPKSDEGSFGQITFAKTTPPKPLPEEGVNPFRKSSNLFRVANLLLKGGTRRSLAEKLATQVNLHPYHKGAEEVDVLDYDKRLLLGAQTMRDQFGYGIQRVGRSIDGKILVFRPGGPKDPRTGKNGSKTTKGKSSKKK